MNDEIKNLRSSRTDDDFFVEKEFVIFDFFLKFINVRALTNDHTIFFEFFFSKFNNDRINQKKLKKIDVATNSISRTRSFWLSFIEAKTTIAWKKVELLREESIFKLKNFDCLYCAKQKLEYIHVFNIACTACNKKRINAFQSLVCFVESLVSSNKSRIESISKNWRWRFEIVNLLVLNWQLTCENKNENVELMSKKFRVSNVKRTKFMKLLYMCFWTLSHHCEWSSICCFFWIEITTVLTQFLRMNDNCFCVCVFSKFEIYTIIDQFELLNSQFKMFFYDYLRCFLCDDFFFFRSLFDLIEYLI